MEEFISFVDAYTRNKIKNGPIPNKRFTEKIFFFEKRRVHVRNTSQPCLRGETNRVTEMQCLQHRGNLKIMRAISQSKIPSRSINSQKKIKIVSCGPMSC